MKENIITVIGSLNYDIIFKQQRLPQKGETFTADSISFAGGGKGANQAVQCAKLGAKTYMIGAVGNDSFGGYLLEELKRFRVNVEHIKSAGTNTGIGVVNALEDGSVLATISTGANYTIDQTDIDRIESLIARSKIVVLQLEIPTEVVEYAIDVASKHGSFIILNAAPAKPISDSALAKVNCLIVNEPEASFYCGNTVEDLKSALENCEALYSKIKDVLIITLGKNGSLVFDGQRKYHIKPSDIKAVESTGAGDSYIGAFSYKLLQGSSFIDAAEFGNKAAEITVTKIGAQSSMPTLEEMGPTNISLTYQVGT